MPLSKNSSTPERLSLRANGKLLLTGEYLVLKGALALAMPLSFGQIMEVSPTSTGHVSWESHDNSGRWFFCDFRPKTLEIIDTDSEAVAQRLLRLLSEARKINHGFLQGNGFNVTVHANYPLKWGLGSSSSVISLVARWAGIDSWTLYQRYSSGSGYDLACAERERPIFYRLQDGKQLIQTANPGPALKQYCYFSYLGNKQDSAGEVSAFLQNTSLAEEDIERISTLTIDICDATDYASLVKKIEDHEKILSGILNKPTLKSLRFPDFPGAVKSLGAWGGDFAMFVTELSPDKVSSVLKKFGLTDTIFTFNELIP